MSSLEEMIQKLSGTTVYEALSRDELLRQSQNRYQSVYGTRRLSARQAYETSDAALERELEGLKTAYLDQLAQSRAGTENTYREADRMALARGMQRSSYNSATLANIRLAGDEQANAITQAHTDAAHGVQQQRTQLSRQLADTLKQLDQDEQSDVLAYVDELEAREYDRVTQSQQNVNQLSMKIYEYQHQLEQEALEQERWQAEFNARYGSKSTGGGGGGSRKKSETQKQTATKSAGATKANIAAAFY